MITSTWIVISLVMVVFLYLSFMKVKKLQEENKVTTTIGLSYLILSIGVGIIIGLTIINIIEDSFDTSDDVCKEYIITHYDDIVSDADEQYRIDTCYLLYWDDITINNFGDSARIIFWGDRNSWKWDLKLDKGFWIYKPVVDTVKRNIYNSDVVIFNLLELSKPTIFFGTIKE